jgi:hypothetical protein
MRCEKITKRIGCGIALLVVGAALSLPLPALAGGQAPLKGSDRGTFTLDECSPGVFRVQIGGSGHATLVGRYEYAASECFDPVAGTYAGMFTVTAANGDRIAGTYSGHVSGTSDPAVAAYEQDMTITAGTGRFEGASGLFEVDGLANLATGAYTQSLAGWLSKP